MQIVAGNEAEAEGIVARVWLVLARNRLPSPKVTSNLQPPSLIVEFQFEQQIHEEVLRKEILSPEER